MSENIKEFESFFLQDTAELFLKDPNGKPLVFKNNRVSAIVYGPSSRQFKVAYNKRIQVLSRLATLKKQEPDASKNVNEEIDSDAQFLKQEQSTFDFLVAVVKEIKNFDYPGGVRGVIETPGLKYFVDQILVFLENEGNFYGAGLKD